MVFIETKTSSVAIAADGRGRCRRPAGADDRSAAVAAAGDPACLADAVCSCPDLSSMPPPFVFPRWGGNGSKHATGGAVVPPFPLIGVAPRAVGKSAHPPPPLL